MPRHNLYAMKVDYGRNCYNCESFGHLVRNCRNQKFVGQEKRVEYRDNQNNGQYNLNGKENLIVLDQVLVITTDLQCSVE